MTPEQLEQAIADARRRMEAHYNLGEYTESKKWGQTMRDLIGERTLETAKEINIPTGMGKDVDSAI
jgi:hypothetical protein